MISLKYIFRCLRCVASELNCFEMGTIRKRAFADNRNGFRKDDDKNTGSARKNIITDFCNGDSVMNSGNYYNRRIPFVRNNDPVITLEITLVGF